MAATSVFYRDECALFGAKGDFAVISARLDMILGSEGGADWLAEDDGAWKGIEEFTLARAGGPGITDYCFVIDRPGRGGAGVVSGLGASSFFGAIF